MSVRRTAIFEAGQAPLKGFRHYLLFTPWRKSGDQFFSMIQRPESVERLCNTFPDCHFYGQRTWEAGEAKRGEFAPVKQEILDFINGDKAFPFTVPTDEENHRKAYGFASQEVPQ